MALPDSLYLALDLARNPRLVGVMQKRRLPHDVLLLIRLAASDPDTLLRMSTRTGRTPEVLREAAVLYIQQVLWTPDADHYRTLGLEQSASHEQLAEHLRWLMKWMHPDRRQLPQEAAFGDRVLSAWNALKTPERRKDYDQSLAGKSTASTKGGKQRRSSRRLPWIDVRGAQAEADRHLLVWRAAGALVVAVGLLAWVLSADWWAPIPRQAAIQEKSQWAADAAAGSGNAVGGQDVTTGVNTNARKVAGQAD